MGLDVYLYKCEKGKKEALRIAEAKYEKFTDGLWKNKKYETMSQEEKDEISKKSEKYALSLGLNKDGCNSVEEKIEINSSKYPDHYFKIGYFRSSYNDGGINHILEQTTGENLYDIFEPGDEYEITPDWKKARKKAVELKDKLIEFSKTSGGIYLTKILKLGDKEITEKEVMDIVMKQKNEKHSFQTYSSSYGLFSFDKPLQVVGVVDTKDYIYVACEGDKSDPDTGYKWYIHALEIIIETIDYVLKSKNPEDYYLFWSS